MSADPFDIRRIELDAETSIWVPAPRPANTEEPDPPASARPTVRVRPAALVGAATAAGVALGRFGPTREGLLAAWVLAVLVLLAAIDVEVRLLPNRIIFPAILCAIAWQAVFVPDRLGECLVAGAVMLLPSLFQPGAIGMGDVKVTAFLGVVLGADVTVALVAGSVLSAPVALAILLVGGAQARRTSLPFGPFLGLGAALALLA